jgi:hypothetical protein
MWMQRRQRAARGLLVPAVLLLASLWTAGLVASTAADATHGLATGRAQPGVQPAALRDLALAFRPVERPSPQGRALPLLLGALAAALAAALRPPVAALRPCQARGRSPARSAPPAARAPPHLQPA